MISELFVYFSLIVVIVVLVYMYFTKANCGRMKEDFLIDYNYDDQFAHSDGMNKDPYNNWCSYNTAKTNGTYTNAKTFCESDVTVFRTKKLGKDACRLQCEKIPE